MGSKKQLSASSPLEVPGSLSQIFLYGLAEKDENSFAAPLSAEKLSYPPSYRGLILAQTADLL